MSEKENAEFKPSAFRLTIDIVSRYTQGGGVR